MSLQHRLARLEKVDATPDSLPSAIFINIVRPDPTSELRFAMLIGSPENEVLHNESETHDDFCRRVYAVKVAGKQVEAMTVVEREAVWGAGQGLEVTEEVYPNLRRSVSARIKHCEKYGFVEGTGRRLGPNQSGFYTLWALKKGRPVRSPFVVMASGSRQADCDLSR